MKQEFVKKKQSLYSGKRRTIQLSIKMNAVDKSNYNFIIIILIGAQALAI